MWRRIPLSILLIIVIGVIASNFLQRESDINTWQCKTWGNKELKYTTNDNKRQIKPVVVHTMKNGSGTIAQCKRYHSISLIYDSDWYELITLYTSSPQINTLDLNNDSSKLIFSAVKKEKHHCLSSAVEGEVRFKGKEVLFSKVKLDFFDTVLTNERTYCMKSILKNNKNINFTWLVRK